MKKYIALLISILVITVFAGCSASKANYDPNEAVIAVETDSTDLTYISKCLADKYLSQFKQNNVPKVSRLKDYEIISVNIVEGNEDFFTCSVAYSVKPTDKNSHWQAGDGELSGSWVRKCSTFIKVQKTDKKYEIISVGTGL